MSQDKLNYEAFRQQLKEEFNIDVTVDQLKDLDAVTKMINNYGYSVTYTSINEQVYTEKRAENNLPPEDDMLAIFRENVCLYTYQLYGRQYKSRGDHPCPLMDTLQQCVLTALYNVIRLLPEGGVN